VDYFVLIALLYREYESSFILLGEQLSYSNLIPPAVSEFTVSHSCQSDCTRRLAEDIKLIGVFIHAHESGRSKLEAYIGNI
jgi:hypothetical protein